MLNLCNDEAMELSVDPQKIKKLKEESEQLKAMVYSSEEYEHEDKNKNQEYDKIEIIRHEQKEPIVISKDKPKVHYSNVFENNNKE